MLLYLPLNKDIWEQSSARIFWTQSKEESYVNKYTGLIWRHLISTFYQIQDPNDEISNFEMPGIYTELGGDEKYVWLI